MPHSVVPDASLDAEIGGFSVWTLHYWNVSLAQIATDPFPRDGTYVEPTDPVTKTPSRTWLFEITEETSISGERIYVFIAEFFPEYAIVYSVHGNEVVVFYLRRIP